MSLLSFYSCSLTLFHGLACFFCHLADSPGIFCLFICFLLSQLLTCLFVLLQMFQYLSCLSFSCPLRTKIIMTDALLYKLRFSWRFPPNLPSRENFSCPPSPFAFLVRTLHRKAINVVLWSLTSFIIKINWLHLNYLNITVINLWQKFYVFCVALWAPKL